MDKPTKTQVNKYLHFSSWLWKNRYFFGIWIHTNRYSGNENMREREKPTLFSEQMRYTITCVMSIKHIIIKSQEPMEKNPNTNTHSCMVYHTIKRLLKFLPVFLQFLLLLLLHFCSLSVYVYIDIHLAVFCSSSLVFSYVLCILWIFK